MKKPNKLYLGSRESEEVFEFLDSLVKFFDYCEIEANEPTFRHYNLKGLVLYFYKAGGAWSLLTIDRQNDDRVFNRFLKFDL